MIDLDFAMTNLPRETDEYDLAWFTNPAKRQTSISRGTKLPREMAECSYAGKYRPFTSIFENSQPREMIDLDFAMTNLPRETDEYDLAWSSNPAKRQTLISR